jgi:mRNA-degrading endonuclease RelE of RelBE toxin-antitoxin system
MVNFRISDAFTGSLARLTGDEQKAVKTTAFDLQMNPANPGMKFHRLDKARDKNFWSVRVNGDIRLIVHRREDSLLLCYVDHHDKAYDWAERRKLEIHPVTGAAQIVKIRETIKEVVVPDYLQEETPIPAKAASKKPLLFQARSDEELLGYGVPAEWLADVKSADEDSLLDLADHLPAEASEALLELAVGGKPRTAQAASTTADPFEHPDAQRRFRIMTNVEELERALDFPWEKWTIFLHPDQKEFVHRDYSGPARVSGSAGTGKTIVGLHRAVHLARANPDARILLATFSNPLANALQTKVRRLIAGEPRLGERIEVHSLPALGLRLHKAMCGAAKIIERKELLEVLQKASAGVGEHRFSIRFLITEWEQIVDAWHLESWEAYRDVARLGRKTRLPEPQRRILWDIFSAVRTELNRLGRTTEAGIFHSLADVLGETKKRPYDFCVVDEAQDISVSQLRFLAAMGGERSNALFFAGDLGQRIFQQPFSWKSQGVDIRGRSRNLKINYRTSHQIRRQADRLLEPEVSDVDGNVENRSETISVFNGSPPKVETFASEKDEIRAVADWIAEKCKDGAVPNEIGVFVRSEAELARAEAAVKQANLPYKILDEHVETASGHVSLCSMHLAKGLEFRVVAVMACDDEVIPLQERISNVGDDSDLQEVYDTERQLLYVACTRARDHLLVSAVKPGSEFLEDLNQ